MSYNIYLSRKDIKPHNFNDAYDNIVQHDDMVDVIREGNKTLDQNINFSEDQNEFFIENPSLDSIKKLVNIARANNYWVRGDENEKYEYDEKGVYYTKPWQHLENVYLDNKQLFQPSSKR